MLGASGLESEFESNPLLSDELFSRPSDFFSAEGISFSFTFELSIFSFISFVSFLSEGFLLSSIFCSNSGSLGYSLAFAGACIKLPEEPLSAFWPGPTLTVCPLTELKTSNKPSLPIN